jgi:hypothetical protein
MPATYEPIATQTLGSAASAVTFSGIPSTYTDLVLVTSIFDANTFCMLRVNNDSASNYSYTYVQGNGSTASSGRGSNQTETYLYSTATTSRNVTILNFQNYANTTTNKTWIQRDSSASSTFAYVNLWRSTSAINRIDIISASATNSILSGSTFTLYGIKAA